MYLVAAVDDFTLVCYAYDLAFIRVELHLPVSFPLLQLTKVLLYCCGVFFFGYSLVEQADISEKVGS